MRSSCVLPQPRRDGQRPSGDFALGRTTVGLGNLDYSNRRSLAETEVTIGAFAVRAYTHANGEVVLPPSLHDQALRHEIASAVRAAALDELADRWAAREAWEKRRLKPAGAASR